MAANASAVWRSRPSGNNNNGGGFDCAISSAATGSHGSWTTSGGTTTFTDATAAFTTGMVNSAINISGVGQFKILTRVDANNITITTMPPWLPANSNFGSAANWTVGSGTDYSQQNSAQVTQSSTANTSTSTTTLTDTGATFTAALIGNGIKVSGTGISTVFTFVTAVPSGTTLTLQTSPGTTGTSVSYSIGGGWADFWTNTAASNSTVAGNRVYILGGASPSYGSPDYTTANASLIAGSSAAGPVRYHGDPATPTTNGFGGYPLIKNPSHIVNNVGWLQWGELFLFASAAGSNLIFGLTGVSEGINVVFDQNGYDVCLNNDSTSGSCSWRNTEVFSSVAKRSGNSHYGMTINTDYGIELAFNNIHDCIGGGITVTGRTPNIRNCIIAKNGGDGINVSSTDTGGSVGQIANNTIDGNAGNGITITTTGSISIISIYNNILSNHTVAGKYGISFTAGSQAVNDRTKPFADDNIFYNNTSNYNGLSPGAHDTVLSSDPYVGQSTENYTLA